MTATATAPTRATPKRLSALDRWLPVNLRDVVALDVDGNGRDDLLWYSRRDGLTVLWRSNGNGTFTSSRLSPGAGKRPTVGDFDGKGGDEILWYGPGNG